MAFRNSATGMSPVTVPVWDEVLNELVALEYALKPWLSIGLAWSSPEYSASQQRKFLFTPPEIVNEYDPDGSLLAIFSTTAYPKP